MTTLKQYVLDRLQEKSTWLGLIGLLGAIGVVVTPDQAQTVAAGGAALAGAVLAATRG